MNKKLLPLLIVLVLLAGGGYYLKTKNSSAPNGPQTASQAMNEAAEFGKAIESGKPTVCTMTKGNDVMEYSIKGKKMRVNTTTNATDENGVTTKTVGHMINDTAYLYMWDDKTGQGTKMAVPTEEETKAAAEKAKQYQSTTPTAPKFDSEADYQGYKDQGYTINCKSGSVDDSVFVAPTNIKFIDPSEMMKQVTSSGAPSSLDLEKLRQQYGGTSQSAE